MLWTRNQARLDDHAFDSASCDSMAGVSGLDAVIMLVLKTKNESDQEKDFPPRFRRHNAPAFSLEQISWDRC